MYDLVVVMARHTNQPEPYSLQSFLKIKSSSSGFSTSIPLKDGCQSIIIIFENIFTKELTQILVKLSKIAFPSSCSFDFSNVPFQPPFYSTGHG